MITSSVTFRKFLSDNVSMGPNLHESIWAIEGDIERNKPNIPTEVILGNDAIPRLRS